MTASDAKLPRIDPALLNQLFDAGEELPEDLRDAILALGSEPVPALIALFEDESLDDEKGPGEGWVRVHAADLLGDIGDAAAVEPLLRAIDSLDMDDVLYSSVSLALPRFGAGLVEPALSLLGEAPSTIVRETVCAALGECGIRDDRIFAELESLFDTEPGLGSSIFASYGDSQALPLLERCIRSGELDPDPRLALYELDALGESYRRLAGEMPGVLEAAAAERYRPLHEAVERGDFPDDELDEESDDDSDEDHEFPVLRQLERHPERPWVWASTCASPDCDCRLARILAARRAEDIEAVLSVLADSWDDEDSPPTLPPELRSAVAVFEVDIDSGSIEVPPWSGGAEATGEGAPPSAAEVIDGRFLDELHDQWLEGKDMEPASTGPASAVLKELSSWKSGELIPYHLAFQQARLDYYEVDGVSYVLIDHHCPDPGCTCAEVVLEWQRLADKVEPVGGATWTPGSPPVFEGKRKALLRDLWARYVARYPDFEPRFKERSRQMQTVGTELLALAEARRKLEPPRHWVPSSGKARKGAPSTRQKPRR